LPALDAVAVVSENLEARVRERAPRARVRFIANGLDDAAVAARVKRGRDAVRAELAVPTGARLVLAVGRLSVEKNHAALIDAAAELPDVVVAIAGEGPLREELVARARERGVAARVRLLGARGDAPDLYRAADVLAHPSTTEGLPMVILEALALGTPIVASAVGEIPRAVDAAGADGEPCGVVVTPGDTAALRRELTRVLGFGEAERAALAARALARVRGKYGVGAMAARYEAELYQK
jgi:glycosyltransferase involved in cell wall biosynthesis